MIDVRNLDKTYVLHTQGGISIPVFKQAEMHVDKGECVTLHGPSGSGKSTLLRCLYGNCKADAGAILIRHGDGQIDLTTAAPRTIIALRQHSLGYVSQFLRAIPRVPAIDVVAEPLRAMGADLSMARDRAAALLARLRIPERLWQLAPATFSGGEQQRVNIARGFASDHPILLLDEPTASLDAANRAVVVQLIIEAKARGVALVGVFHDDEVREAVSSRIVTMQPEVCS
ncbi:phosphonate C-P lyase system protein PhnL [Magnetospirillum sulfuroxidans]|uniref:Phosphonate C-P lyase system protein PhnL n=1 Tax=Magnetospirillum sulfuroxidans TaxID=611300 RepID=A0ABS5IBG8_9PROT|nr:phosphonate C-P lyase system protein PhnL [Magnetospirillum sulfuroxidans]MBR9971487.1 phosphonate C-P lyase system protein PhnL [Magnetospirillum sulfuroxidans]